MLTSVSQVLLLEAVCRRLNGTVICCVLCIRNCPMILYHQRFSLRLETLFHFLFKLLAVSHIQEVITVLVTKETSRV